MGAHLHALVRSAATTGAAEIATEENSVTTGIGLQLEGQTNEREEGNSA
jgi:hypothetical protein